MSKIIMPTIFGLAPNVNSVLNMVSQEQNYLRIIVSPVVDLVLSYFQGYHPIIVKQKLHNCLHEIREKAILYFENYNIIQIIHKIDYLQLLKKLATNSVAFFKLDPELKDKTFEGILEFDYEGMMTYIGYIDNPLYMHSNDGRSCCYIDIRSHGQICVETEQVGPSIQDIISVAVPIIYPRRMDIIIKSTAQTSNYSFGYRHYNYTRKCIYGLEVEREDEREDIFKECFNTNYNELKKESIDTIRTNGERSANFNEYAVDKPTVYTSNFIDKHLQAYENLGGRSPNGMFGVAVYFNSLGFYPGMDLLKTVDFKIFMKTRSYEFIKFVKSNMSELKMDEFEMDEFEMDEFKMDKFKMRVCITLQEYIDTYLQDMNSKIYYFCLRELCMCYEPELRDEIRGLVERFCDHRGSDFKEIFSVEPNVVGDYRLSDVFDFFAINDPKMRLIILDRSCSGINERGLTLRETRAMVRSTLGGRSKKNKKSKNRRKTRKQRKTR